MIFKKPIAKIINEQGAEICQKYNCLGIAEGTKITNGVDTKEKCLTFIVKKKILKTSLLKEEKVPKKIGGWKSDILEVGEIVPMSGHRSRHRPVIGGISGKVVGGSACSIALICYKDNQSGILTNEHCFHIRGQNKAGSSFLQPSPIDGGREPLDNIGVSNDPPRITNTKQNKIDSIFIPLLVSCENEVRRIPNYTKKHRDPVVGDRFQKPSRTTDFTEGVITHINALSRVNFGGSLGVCEFFPTVWALQTNFNLVAGGDSGSGIFSEQGDFIGQTFAAGPNLAIFLPASSIIQELGINLDLPENAWIALGQHTKINKLEITLTARTNLRKSPEIADNIIRVLPRGTKLRVLGETAVANNFLWVKVR